ncbi:hypothetical protein ES708_07297 [subsurface metagenome]
MFIPGILKFRGLKFGPYGDKQVGGSKPGQLQAQRIH